MIIEQLREDLSDAKAIRPKEPEPRASIASVGSRPSETSMNAESPSTLNTYREKKYQSDIKQLSELLNDSENNINHLNEQKEVGFLV
jgi:hypothetical protein